MAIAEAPTATVAGPRPVVHADVKAVPNRHRLTDHFPSLSFSLRTGGLPFFDLLLTTDPSLFDPANAGKRNASNFYASHQDGGLSAARDGHGSYLVPSAVIRGFAAAMPKPVAIFYTVIAYMDRDGKGPVFALAPDDLASHAPSVALPPDFKGQTLARIMGVSSEKLRLVTDTPPDGGRTKETDGADDAGAGDGAYGLAPPAIAGPAPMVAPAQGDFVLERMTLSPGPGPAGEPRLVRRPSAAASAQGADERLGQAAVPAYLGGEGEDGAEAADGEAYAAAPGSGGSGGAGSRLDAREEAAPGGDLAYRNLEDGSPVGAPTVATPAHRLDADARRKIILRIAQDESGGDYSAINADGEFEGKFPGHPAIGKYHVGLSFGLIQFAQDSSLGELLTAMRARDGKAFREIFGDQSDELIRVTTATGPPSSQTSTGRSARVQPVGGVDLWKEPWLSRFKRAGQYRPFQEVQEQLAASRYLDPLLQFATWLGLDSERALTMVVDRSIQMGAEGAKRWIISTVGPVATTALQPQALAALGHTDLRGFQAATAGLQADGVLGPMTHAAMVAALRKLGSASPIPVMTRDQMLDAMVRRSAHDPWRARIERLRNDAALSDVPFQP